MDSRSQVIVLYEAPCADPSEGACRWCGEPIVLVDPSDYRRARRTIHYGDSHERGERRECRKAFLGARVWDARAAVRWRELREHGIVACVDCGVVCEDHRPEAESRFGASWEADHEVPLHVGGPHVLDNLRSRCVPCHRGKTAHEARARSLSRVA